MKESKAIFSRRNEGEPRTTSFIFEDGHTDCSCCVCTPIVECEHIPAPQPQPNSQVMMRDLEDKVLRAMQVGLPLPKLDFSIGIDYSKEMIFTAKADAVPPKPLPRRKFRL